MSEQQYRVVADRDNGDDPRYIDIRQGDRVTYMNRGKGIGSLVPTRIERPVPTTEPKRMLLTHPHDGHGPDDTCRECETSASPSLPTREQIAEVVLDGFHAPDGNHPSWWLNPLATADAVLALLQKGADR